MTRAVRVSIYLSTYEEISTRYIARALWGVGKGVCVPAWSPFDQRYHLCELHPHMRLVTGRFNIREPLEQIPVMSWDVDAFILPGLAFDKQGGRLGYGKGIYDEILFRANPSALKIGICYDWPILDDPLPLDPHDMRVDWVVSDKRAIDCKGGQGN
jgi:5-formyltetrahydrofolate cyclo-ligase